MRVSFVVFVVLLTACNLKSFTTDSVTSPAEPDVTGSNANQQPTQSSPDSLTSVPVAQGGSGDAVPYFGGGGESTENWLAICKESTESTNWVAVRVDPDYSKSPAGLLSAIGFLSNPAAPQIVRKVELFSVEPRSELTKKIYETPAFSLEIDTDPSRKADDRHPATLKAIVDSQAVEASLRCRLRGG